MKFAQNFTGQEHTLNLLPYLNAKLSVKVVFPFFAFSCGRCLEEQIEARDETRGRVKHQLALEIVNPVPQSHHLADRRLEYLLARGHLLLLLSTIGSHHSRAGGMVD